MNLILLGAPGAGKGTQAEFICEKLSIPAISTGNLIREAMRNGTELGRQAKQYVESGGLVPDEMVIALIQERIAQDDCKNGYILDGFPRTVPQAEALDRMGVVLDKVINFEVDDAVIIARLAGRRVCQTCGASYHIEHKPTKEDNKCDKCAGDVVARADDAPDTIRRRLQVYHEQTKPLEEYYAAAGKLVAVKALGSVEEITQRAFAVLEA